MRKFTLVLTSIFVMGYILPMLSQANFSTSLHKTREGKNDAYKTANGGMELITNIPMDSLACKKCHSTTETYPNGDLIISATYVPDCKDCHNFAAGSTVAEQTCKNCHNRQVYEIAAYPDSLANGDVHRKAGMTCITCHTKAEIHGDDGIAYALLKENGAIQTECMDCHSPLPTNSAHATHSATVDCAACHAVSVLTCAGCHFETVVAIGKNRAINQIKGYRLLVKKNDKVHLGGFMTHSFQGKTNVIVSSYHSHVIAKNATTCADCHQNMGGTNPVITEYNNTGRMTMTTWNPTTKKIVGPSGVVPLTSDWKTAFKLDYVTYTGDSTILPGDPNLWVYLKSETDNAHLFYCEPLDDATLTKLGFTRLPVPVELTAFIGSVSGSDVKLEWNTATEINNNGFEIQRKTNKDFATVGFVKGNGTSTNSHEYTIVDKQLQPGSYSYRLKQIDFDGKYEFSKIIEVEVVNGLSYSLEQNYPNPFNPETAIKYSIPQNGKVTVKIFNITGNEIMTLVDKEMLAGSHEVKWNGKDNTGTSVTSGVYFVRLSSGNYVETKKMMYLK